MCKAGFLSRLFSVRFQEETISVAEVQFIQNIGLV
jgi:hypothetical protein